MIRLTEICIKRPVLAIVLNLILVLIGILGFHYLSTSFLPKYAAKSIMITTNYPGASAQLVESSLTTPLEQALNNIDGIDIIESLSNAQMSTITISLLPSYDVYEIANKIRNQVAIASSVLPPDVKPPTVQAGHGSMDLMDIGFTANDRSLAQLRDYIDRFITNQIAQIPGVSGVDIGGANQLAMQINLDPQKMTQSNLDINSVINAIQINNIQLPAGAVKTEDIDYPINADTQLKSAAEFSKLVIQENPQGFTRLGDIAQVMLTDDNQDETLVKVNGTSGIVMTIYNETDANPIEVSNQVLHFFKQFQSQLPPGIKANVVFNQADFMKSSVREVYTAIGIAILCVVIISFVFLGNLRSTLIPVVTIPVCVIATFGLIYFLGFNINVITLLAIVLSIGLVVDDAIVMLENIYRHLEKGLSPLKASIDGSRQITFAVIAMTLTLVAVYAPIAFTTDKAGAIFPSFAFTLAGAVIISGFVALTLSPMMCAYSLKLHSQQKGYSRMLEQTFSALNRYYQKTLELVLKKRFIILIFTVLLAVFGYYLFLKVPKGFTPQEDMGLLIANINSPSGVNANYNQKQIDRITQFIQNYPEVQNTLSISASGDKIANLILLQLKPYEQRKRDAQTIANALNEEIKNNPDLTAMVINPNFGGSKQHGLEFYIMGSGTYDDLYHSAQNLVNDLNKYPGLSHVTTDMTINNQQYQLTVDRELASNLQIPIKNIDDTLANLLGGSAISSFDWGGKRYDVRVQAADSYLHSINSINEFSVRSLNGKLIPLSNLVHIEPIITQASLSHFNRLRAAQISGQISKGYTLGEVVAYLQHHLPQVLPATVKYEFSDMAKKIIDSSQSSGLIFVLALVFIYLVLSAQFESFIDPLIILFAVPFSIVSALACLKLINGSINIYTSIGLVTLIGLVAKHGILITQFANQLQAEGLKAEEALVRAASIRLRPILMTTAAMIFGALPLLLATGASAESRREIGMVITSGLFFGTFFSLILVPVSYSYAAQFKIWLWKGRMEDEGLRDEG